MEQWWKKSVFYQIYMPSFFDGNRDGIGDFAGIRAKLTYLKKLGVGGIWLTPFYKSPKVDQGYDISDYYEIDSDYGTMEEFEAFIQEAHSLGIKVISDVVINHTSSQHKWFLESRSSEFSPKRDWYIWRKTLDGKEPNNWQSFFGGKAWEYDESTKSYYYHSFAKEQVDLNWANPEVKEAVFEMLQFWVEKGLDGFRLDVINNLTLTECMTDNPFDESGKQIHLYDVNQTGIHDFMRELKQHLSKKRDIFLVGEVSSDKLNVIHSFVGEGQLDTTFNFNLGSMNEFVFSELYNQLTKMTELYQGDNYPTIFFGSHDLQRFPSRFCFNDNQVKNLFTLMMSYRAIPFIYFGDEIGMKNYECYQIEDARDIQGIIAYNQVKASEKSEEECIRILNEKSRDHSRNTMYWNDCPYGGFSEVDSWINYQNQPGQSVQVQMETESSIFSYVSKLNHYRTEKSLLIDGDCIIESPKSGVIICRRLNNEEEIRAVINFLGEDFEMQIDNLRSRKIEIFIETNTGAALIEGNRLLVKAENGVMLSLKI